MLADKRLLPLLVTEKEKKKERLQYTLSQCQVVGV
jgi:hypothetical protein